MASVFGHGVVAFTLAKVIDKSQLKLLLFPAILSSILPDIDILAFKFGIHYEHMFGHRGFTHSIVFAILWATLLTVVFSKGRQLIFFLVLFLSTISHGVLDAMTSGGRGVGFFIPFTDERYFFPFRAIKVSPIGVERFFSEWGIRVLLSEFKYIFLPCLLILLSNYLIKRQFKSN